MEKKELQKNYEEQDSMGRELLLEKLAFCNSSLYQQECFLMLMNMLNRYKERFILADSSLLQDFESDDALMERLSRIGVLSDV